ncbi:MAG TPA: DUF1598 domain-containing protein [Pirellulaceae bacterium]|nr:DUF1598 domain-containing protein [Pirellulaceae bacterium]
MEPTLDSRLRSTARRGAASVCALVAAAGLLCLPAVTRGQASVSFGTQRPFVVGFIPVVGASGAVGGVSIDADGVVARSDLETRGRLREARLAALKGIDSDIQSPSPLRKVSLRRLQRAIDKLAREKRPLPNEIQCLAGLQRVEYVLIYPEQQDIVLAGYAEGWRIDEQGNVVGQKTGLPVLRLDDLVVSLRTAEAAASGQGISCSIDPTEDGLKQFQRLLKSRDLAISEATVARLEESIGPQQITVTGVAPGSHFAHVLVGADFLMKRLAMNFEASPVEGMPSYMEMLQERSAPTPRSAMPRWWMAVNYEPLLKDDDALAWQLRGTGVQVLTEEGFLGKRGTIVAGRDRENSLAKKWSETMTSKYEALSAALPAFGELRNCMDLAVVAALITKEDLSGRAGCDLSLLLDEKRIAIAEHPVPRMVDSRASLVRKGRNWIVSISGGVEIDSWSVLNRAESSPELAKTRSAAAPREDEKWWWD